MTKVFNYLLIAVFFSTLLSCVANRKYQDEVVARTAAMDRALKAEQQLKETEEEHEKTKEEVKKLEKEFAEIKEDYTLLESRYKKQQELNKDLQDSYDKLLALNEKLRGDATSKRKELTEELSRKELELQRKTFEIEKKERDLKDAQARLEREREDMKKLREELEGKNSSISSLEQNKSDLEKSLKDREDKVKSLEGAIATREKKVSDLEAAVAAREERVKELEAAMAARDAKTKALREKLNEAMTGFKSSDLSVEEKNGKVYVSLSQNLLFTTGSSRLDSKGASAINKLAEVLNKNSDISVLVEGHTDSDGDAKMNWELSTKRSLSIVNQLIKGNVAPERITAAGRGEHVPVASNSTSEGKAKNRRTDIILSPKLDAIMDLIKG